MPIIGYVHICQLGDWKRSFQMLMDAVYKSGLYEKTEKIRIGVVNNPGVLIKDNTLNDPKFEILCLGRSWEYERPTLLHMRKHAETDPDDTIYYYLHTKGIKHFGKPYEQCIVDWIHLMLYWNIERWQLAVEKLKTFDTYGCNSIGKTRHYSGNFWWANRKHIITLPTAIGRGYTAPEDWVCIKANCCTIYKSGFQGMGHYNNVYPRSKYVKQTQNSLKVANPL